jgi:predicted RNase H-like nuclease (RuvC/YqgF family)
MDWAAIINGALGAGVIGVIYKLIDAYLNRDKSRADVKLTGSEEVENTIEAAGKVVGLLGSALDYLRKENGEYKEIIKELRASDRVRGQEIAELQAGRVERIKLITDQGQQIVELQAQNEDLQTGLIATQRQIEVLERNYAAEISRLKHQWREWYDTLRGWLNEKGLTDYPEPPSGLLDTGDHIKGGK